MARPIADYHDDGGALQRGILDRSTTRSTARAFAAAITALAISTLVITTSSDALVEDGTIAETHLEAGPRSRSPTTTTTGPCSRWRT